MRKELELHSPRGGWCDSPGNLKTFGSLKNLVLGLYYSALLRKLALTVTLIEYYVDPEYLGKVMNILMMQFGLICFVNLFVGLLIKAVWVQWAVGGFAMGLAFLSILSLTVVSHIRNLE